MNMLGHGPHQGVARHGHQAHCRNKCRQTDCNFRWLLFPKEVSQGIPCPQTLKEVWEGQGVPSRRPDPIQKATMESPVCWFRFRGHFTNSFRLIPPTWKGYISLWTTVKWDARTSSQGPKETPPPMTPDMHGVLEHRSGDIWLGFCRLSRRITEGAHGRPEGLRSPDNDSRPTSNRKPYLTRGPENGVSRKLGQFRHVAQACYDSLFKSTSHNNEQVCTSTRQQSVCRSGILCNVFRLRGAAARAKHIDKLHRRRARHHPNMEVC
jgi:hypothetical protein